MQLESWISQLVVDILFRVFKAGTLLYLKNVLIFYPRLRYRFNSKERITLLANTLFVIVHIYMGTLV